MKLLLFYAHAFSYKTAARTLSSAPEIHREEEVSDAAVIFFHVEKEDVAKRGKVIQKFVKNVKWLCGRERLARTGFLVMATPFGYFNEFTIHVAGDSLAKVFKEF